MIFVDMYVHLVYTLLLLEFSKVFGSSIVLQDDPATIHCSDAAFEVPTEFSSRIPDDRATKVGNIFPIENVWIIAKTRGEGQRTQNPSQAQDYHQGSVEGD